MNKTIEYDSELKGKSNLLANAQPTSMFWMTYTNFLCLNVQRCKWACRTKLTKHDAAHVHLNQFLVATVLGLYACRTQQIVGTKNIVRW